MFLFNAHTTAYLYYYTSPVIPFALSKLIWFIDEISAVCQPSLTTELILLLKDGACYL